MGDGVKLTEPQARALKEVSEGRVRYAIYWAYRSTVFPPAVRTDVCMRLAQRGLLTHRGDGESVVALTDAGREALAEWEARNVSVDNLDQLPESSRRVFRGPGELEREGYSDAGEDVRL